MSYTDKVHGKTTEHSEQVAIFDWARLMEEYCPELALLHAIPSGGHRHKSVGAYMKAEGTKRGVPDLCLPIPRGNYHGMYIEIKIGKNKPTKEQREWLAALAEQGYRVDVQYGADNAIKAICEYLGVEARFL